jgi:hypothetical protein
LLGLGVWLGLFQRTTTTLFRLLVFFVVAPSLLSCHDDL